MPFLIISGSLSTTAGGGFPLRADVLRYINSIAITSTSTSTVTASTITVTTSTEPPAMAPAEIAGDGGHASAAQGDEGEVGS